MLPFESTCALLEREHDGSQLDQVYRASTIRVRLLGADRICQRAEMEGHVPEFMPNKLMGDKVDGYFWRYPCLWFGIPDAVRWHPEMLGFLREPVLGNPAWSDAPDSGGRRLSAKEYEDLLALGEP